MNRSLVAAAALAAVVWGGSAQAADMPVKAPPLAPRVLAIPFNWTGFYVGLIPLKQAAPFSVRHLR